MPAIETQMTGIQEMDLPALRDAWRRHYRVPPPRRLSRDLLMRGIAYKLQEQVHGGLSKAARRRLRALAQAFAETGRVAPRQRHQGAPRHTAGARMARPHPCRHRDGKRLRLRRGGLWFLDRYRPTHHGRALVRSSLLRPAAFRRERIGGGAWLSIGNHHGRRVRPRCVAPSTPANPPKKASSRTSTRCRRSGRPARPISRARSTRAGSCCPPFTTMAVSPAPPWSARRCNACSPMSRSGGSTRSSSTRSTG